MRESGAAANVLEGSNNAKNLRKPMESFVPWKKTCPSIGQLGTKSAARTDSRGRGKKGELPICSTAGPKQSALISTSGRLSIGKENVQGPAVSTLRGGRYSQPKTAHTAHNHAEASRTEAEETGMGGRASLRGGLEALVGGNSSSRKYSAISTQTVPEEIYNRDRRFSALHNVRMREDRLTGGTPAAKGKTSPHAVKTSTSSRDRTQYEREVRGKFGVHSSVDDEEDALIEEDRVCRENTPEKSMPRPQSSLQALRFCLEDPNGNSVTDIDDEGDGLHMADRGLSDEEDDGDNVQDLICRTEMERKKERRQERAWLEKEGEKRRKEGLPRNFLLVDEFTKMPYGVGVGDWRKELMLMSRDLDPSIGNINRQPEGAVAEIAEWIKDTWEYSSPVKFECVKEVIARGITLRRVELWKKIRNGEPKPSGMSDRTWRTLERQLDNPASIRKSENCRRANASRVNFGRTGPSGEVGVRKRLRRILKRSPDPDEIRFEMRRDKGYGGRHRSEGNSLSVMHGSGGVRKFSTDVERMYAADGNFQEDISENEDEEVPQNKSEEVNAKGRTIGENGEKAVGGTVSAISVEEISKHPFVALMMQRLQALEGTQSDAVMHERCEPSEEVQTAPERDEAAEGQHISQELQDAAHLVQSDEIEASRTLRRLKKKTRQG